MLETVDYVYVWSLSWNIVKDRNIFPRRGWNSASMNNACHEDNVVRIAAGAIINLPRKINHSNYLMQVITATSFGRGEV
jgi:hypothetical protein